MKFSFAFVVFIVYGFIGSTIMGQCFSIPVADSSFEQGTLGYKEDFLPGSWYPDDGIEISADYAFSGDSSAHSTAGGAYQLVEVSPNTTYYLSCYVKNGLDDPFLHFLINQQKYDLKLSSNDWTLVSQSFNSGDDTLAYISFYSSDAYFDLFRLTCEPLLATDEQANQKKPFLVFPSISSDKFTIKTQRNCSVQILNLQGIVIEHLVLKEGTYSFGDHLPSATYLIKIIVNKQVWIDKIVKL